jgi:uncharacterized membrane protein YraQ (UPF0718 family)
MFDSFSIFSAITTSIFLEAMPFLAMGALLSAMIEVFVSTDRLVRYLPKGTVGGIAVGVTAGLILPTCECGVVPIVRRLIQKGVPIPTAIAFMLSAPVINPVVIASTYIAFQGDPPMVLGRILMVAGVAAAVALAASRMGNIMLPGGTFGGGHGHDHIHGAEEGAAQIDTATGAHRITEVLRHGLYEFVDMGKFLILGAIAAGLIKTYLPQDLLLFFDGQPVLEIVGMMSLAILLSVCSEADAFVAKSFVSFSSASQLAFVVIGPMIDLKLIGMYAATFQRRFFGVLMIVPILLILVLSILYGAI